MYKVIDLTKTHKPILNYVPSVGNGGEISKWSAECSCGWKTSRPPLHYGQSLLHEFSGHLPTTNELRTLIKTLNIPL